MKKLTLKNSSYKHLLQSFKEWLSILGYAKSTVYGLPNQLQEFFFYLEANNINRIDQITTQTVTNYYKQLEIRANETRDGALSKSYLNKHQQALKRFNEYLKQHNSKGFNIHLKPESNPTEERINILTQSEVKKLFKACEYSHELEHFRLRDKAILTIFYSCGIRRNEGVHLDLTDVMFNKELIYVRKGKNYKERFVPINKRNLLILEDYIYEGRPHFSKGSKTEALFLSRLGNRLTGMSLANRLTAIIRATEDYDIIDKDVTLHSLRHAIATHLLQLGMPLESIKTFLGHTSLESTQIYVHLLKNIDE